MITAGIIMGLMTFTAIVILVEKLPRWLKMLVYGHQLISDVLFTALSFTLFPLTGAATLINSAVFCLLFSIYLMVRKKSRPWMKIELGGPTVFHIAKSDLKK